MFLDALPLSYTGSVLGGLCSMCHDALVRIDDYTDNRFRSCDLKVMSLARCPCAMSVKFRLCELDRVEPTTRSHIHIVVCL